MESVKDSLKWLSQSTPLFECPDLIDRKGIVVVSTWMWKPSEKEMFGLLFSRLVPLSVDLSDIENGGVKITGVSPELPRWVGGPLKAYTARFRFDDGKHWFDGFVELGAVEPAARKG